MLVQPGDPELLSASLQHLQLRLYTQLLMCVNQVTQSCSQLLYSIYNIDYIHSCSCWSTRRSRAALSFSTASTTYIIYTAAHVGQPGDPELLSASLQHLQHRFYTQLLMSVNQEIQSFSQLLYSISIIYYIHSYSCCSTRRSRAALSFSTASAT